MKITYDDSADAAYIYLADNGEQKVANTHPYDIEGGSIALDFDGEGRMLGIEILQAKRLLPPEVLEKALRLNA